MQVSPRGPVRRAGLGRHHRVSCRQRASRPVSRERVRCSLPPAPLTGRGLQQLKWVVRVLGAQLHSPKKRHPPLAWGRDRCLCQKWVDSCVRMLHSGGGRDAGRLEGEARFSPEPPARSGSKMDQPRPRPGSLQAIGEGPRVHRLAHRTGSRTSWQRQRSSLSPFSHGDHKGPELGEASLPGPHAATQWRVVGPQPSRSDAPARRAHSPPMLLLLQNVLSSFKKHNNSQIFTAPRASG